MRLQAYVYLGWSPRLAVVPNGTNQVLQVVGWDGGSGTAPATGLYVGSTGYVTNITDGVNIKGAAGGGGGNGAALNFTGGNTFGNTFLASNGTVNWIAGNNISLSLDSLNQNATIIGNTPLVFSNSNGISFGTNAGTVTATVATNYLNLSQSSLFQQSSLMSNYQPSGAYLTTAMLSNAGSNFVGLNSAITNGSMTLNSSGLSINLPNYLTTAMQSNAGSNFLSVSQSSLFQQTSLMSNYAGLGTTFAGTNISGSMTLNSNGLNLALSGGAGGGGGNINVSAGTTSNNMSAFTMSNANGVSFGLNGSVITASVAAAGGAQTGISGISAGTTILTAGTLSFGNGSGVSFGLNGSVLTATVATNYQSQGNYLTTAMLSNAATISNINFSAGTTSGNLSALTFANSNGVSFGLNGGTVTATVATNYQSQGAYLTTAMQSNAATISNINFSAGTTSGNLSALTFANGGGVSFGLNAGTVTATVATNYQSQGAYLTTAMVSNAGSNFVGLNSAITNGSMTVNSSGISINLPNYLTTAMASNAGSNFVGLNTAITNGLMTANSSGISLNLSNLLTTAMASNAGSNFAGLGTTFAGTNISASMTMGSNGLNLALSAGAGGGGGSINFSAGTTSNNLAAITFANSNGISFGLNGSVMTGSVAAAGGAQTGISGISAGTTVLTNGTLSFGNSNGITFGLNGSVITGTVATNYQSQGAYLTTAMASNAATISNVNLSAGTTSANLSAFVFSNSNNVSFGLTNGSQVTASASFAQTVQPMYYSASGTSSSSGTIQFGNTQGVSFSLSNGSIVGSVATNYQSQGAYLTTAMASNAGSNFVGLGSAITNGTMTFNSAGLSLNLSNHLTTAMVSNAGSNFAGLNSAITNGLMTYNSSGLSLNLSNLLTTAMVSNAGSNFVGLNSAVTGASLTVNSSGISINVPAAAPSPVYVIAGTTNGSLGTISFANSNGVSFGLNGSVITASAAGGGGGGIVLANSQTTYTSGTANMIASGALTIGSTTGQSFYFSAPAQSSLSATGQVSISVNGSTISIGVPNAIMLSEYEPFPLGNNTTFSSAGQSSIYLQKIQPQQNFSFSAIERLASLSFASSTNNASVNYSIQYGIYSRDLGASSTRMTQMGSSQMDIRAAFSSNSSMAASIVVGANTVATGSAGTALYSNITAGKHIYFPYATSLAGGNEYWVAFNVLSASTITSTPLRIAFLELTNINNLTWGKINSASFFATNASYVDDFAQGVFTAQSAALPATIADNQITNQVSMGKMFINFDNN
jgi:hypothetical protein